jgi:hypothetical protein
VTLNPGEAESYAWLANVLSYAGRSAEALEQLEHARPSIRRCGTSISRALVHLGRYEDSLPWLAACGRRAPGFAHRLRYQASALAHLGRLDDVRVALADPTVTDGYASIGDICRFESFVEGIELDRLIEGLRAAGFPE